MLAEHLREFTNSTACYIGELVGPTKPISDGDDDTAHIDTDNEKIIKYLNATKEAESVLGQILL